jgi:hypothetical protein
VGRSPMGRDSDDPYPQPVELARPRNSGELNPIIGNPAFAPDDYHLTFRSVAIDAGADEWCTRVFLPLTLKP